MVTATPKTEKHDLLYYLFVGPYTLPKNKHNARMMNYH